MEQQSLRPLEWYGEQSILNTICMDMPIQNYVSEVVATRDGQLTA